MYYFLLYFFSLIYDVLEISKSLDKSAYIFLALSTMFYIYESIAQYKANGAYIMVAATTIMLDVVNRSIHKENFDNSKMV